MTFNRLCILLGILVVIAGVGILWLWQYAYSPEGRALVIIAQLKNDKTTLRGWMLQHHIIRPGFKDLPEEELVAAKGQLPSDNFYVIRGTYASNEMVKLGRDVLPIALAAIGDADKGVRIAAIRTCGEFCDPIAIPPLIRCMRETKICRSSSSIEVGGRVVQSGPTGILEADTTILIICQDSLVQIGPKATDPLIQTLDDPDEEVRANAAEALGRLQDDRATEALIRHLQDEDDEVKRKAAKALGEIGNSSSIKELSRMLTDLRLDRTVRIPVAGALTRMKQDEGLQFLRKMAKSSDPSERCKVADELGHSNNPAVLDLVIKLAFDTDFGVRNWAIGAIEDLHDPRAIPTLRKLLHDPDENIRSQADDVLKHFDLESQPSSQKAR